MSLKVQKLQSILELGLEFEKHQLLPMYLSLMTITQRDECVIQAHLKQLSALLVLREDHVVVNTAHRLDTLIVVLDRDELTVLQGSAVWRHVVVQLQSVALFSGLVPIDGLLRPLFELLVNASDL